MNLTLEEIATKAEVTSRTAMRWPKYDGFPKPVGDKQIVSVMARIYDWSSVKDWPIKTGRWDDVVDIPTGRVFHS